MLQRYFKIAAGNQKNSLSRKKGITPGQSKTTARAHIVKVERV